jgi:hypothetical protein
MNNYVVEVTDSLELLIWETAGSEFPVISQPHWPDRTPWNSATEAEEWANVYIESVTNPDYGYSPGSNPSEPIVANLEPEVAEEQPAP